MDMEVELLLVCMGRRALVLQRPCGSHSMAQAGAPVLRRSSAFFPLHLRSTYLAVWSVRVAAPPWPTSSAPARLWVGQEGSAINMEAHHFKQERNSRYVPMFRVYLPRYLCSY